MAQIQGKRLADDEFIDPYAQLGPQIFLSQRATLQGDTVEQQPAEDQAQ